VYFREAMLLYMFSIASQMQPLLRVVAASVSLYCCNLYLVYTVQCCGLLPRQLGIPACTYHLHLHCISISQHMHKQALTRLRDSSKRVVALTKALAEAKAGREQALTQCDAAEHRAAAAARELAYYARLAKESGLALNGQTNGASQGSDSPMKNGASTAANGVSAEHAKLQAAASATVASLKALLQEKNATIDRLQRRLDEVRAAFTIPLLSICYSYTAQEMLIV
jgi:hypothetical protein